MVVNVVQQKETKGQNSVRSDQEDDCGVSCEPTTGEACSRMKKMDKERPKALTSDPMSSSRSVIFLTTLLTATKGGILSMIVWYVIVFSSRKSILSLNE